MFKIVATVWTGFLLGRCVDILLRFGMSDGQSDADVCPKYEVSEIWHDAVIH